MVMKWKYKVCYFKIKNLEEKKDFKKELESKLNEFGQKEWELIYFIRQSTFTPIILIFKKPKK